jgi:hypothetical protein
MIGVRAAPFTNFTRVNFEANAFSNSVSTSTAIGAKPLCVASHADVNL